MSKNRRIVKVGLGSIATIATIILTVLLLNGNLNNDNDGQYPDICFNLEEANSMTVNYCARLKCKFKVSQCTNECPLGHPIDSDNCPVSCECASSGLYGFDVAFASDHVPSLLKKFGYVEKSDVPTVFNSAVRIAKDGKYGLWKKDSDGLVRVPYFFKPGFKQPGFWSMVMDWFKENTCVRFVKTDPSCKPPCVKVTDKGRGICSAYIGSQLLWVQEVTLGRGCQYLATIVHELFHVLGVDHTQTRADRDEYVYVAYEHIMEDWAYSYNKFKYSEVYDLGVPYDIHSTMHYNSITFSKTINGEKKLSMYDLNDVNGNGYIEGGGWPTTELDKILINTMYRCSPEYDKELKVGTPPPARPPTMVKLDKPEISEGENWMTWGLWSRWMHDSRFRTRACKTYRAQEYGSKFFCGDKLFYEYELRKLPTTDPDGGYDQFMKWSEWYPCMPREKGCDGVRMRFRDWVPVAGRELEPASLSWIDTCKIEGCTRHIQEDADNRYIIHPKFDYRWGAWNPTEKCSVTCGGGTYTVKRECRDSKSEKAKRCGDDGKDEETKTAACNQFPCIDGGSSSSASRPAQQSPLSDEVYGWAKWGMWNRCTDGRQKRFRICQGVTQGLTCPGQSSDTRECISAKAQADLQYTAWGEWGDCLLQKIDSCAGVKIRYRSCLSSNGCDTKGKAEMKACYRCSSHGEIKWTRWKDSECSATCQGSMRRTRDCFDSFTNKASAKCVGSKEETIPCNTQSCDRKPKLQQSTTVFAAVSSETKTMPCADKTSQWVFGHFTGDKKVEAICTGTSGKLQLMPLIGSNVSSSLWSGKLLDCMGDDVIKYAADINGDQFDDLICKKPNSRLYHVHLKRYGEFSAIPDYSTALCERDETPIFLNLNGDLRQDALCRNQRSGKTNIFINRFTD